MKDPFKKPEALLAEGIEKAYRAGVRDEREAIAVMFDEGCPLTRWAGKGPMPYHDSCAACRAAQAIRARGEKA